MPMFTLNDHSRRAASRRLVEAYSWFEQSQAIKLFDHKKPHGAAETYPFGL
ncbi:MAG: hypothetical protein RIQ28_986 [Pseudomonadota bacterium]